MLVCDYAEAVAEGTTTYGRLGSLHDTCATISPGKFCAQSITAQTRVEPGSGQGWGAFENAGKGAASRHRTNTGAVSGHPNYLVDARHSDGGGDQVRFV